MIPWYNNTIRFNPGCSTCVYQSHGKGCNASGLDPCVFFVCEEDIIDVNCHKKTCFGCGKEICRKEDGIEIVDGTESKWMCLDLFQKIETCSYVLSKLNIYPLH